MSGVMIQFLAENNGLPGGRGGLKISRQVGKKNGPLAPWQDLR
jgi:hypothetical protein